MIKLHYKNYSKETIPKHTMSVSVPTEEEVEAHSRQRSVTLVIRVPKFIVKLRNKMEKHRK